MTTAYPSPDSLKYALDAVYPATGIFGYLILLKGDLLTNASASVDIVTNKFTTASPHGLVVGSRIRVAGSTLPAPTAEYDEYYVIPTSATDFKIADTLDNAQAGTAIDTTTAGSGVLINEQYLSIYDPPEVLINKELAAVGGYQRLLISDLGADYPAFGAAYRATKTISFVNTGASNILHQHVLIARGASASVGDAAGIVAIDLLTEPVDQVTLPGQQRDFGLNFLARAYGV
jgi:hypothetical protein